MALALMPFSCTAKNVKFREGDKNGKHWDSTSFIAVVPYMSNGEVKEEKWLVESWSKLPIADGNHCIIHKAYLRRAKKQNSDEFETRVYADLVEVIGGSAMNEEDYGEESDRIPEEDYDNIPFQEGSEEDKAYPREHSAEGFVSLPKAKTA